MSDYVSRDAVVKWVDDSIEMCGNQYTTEQENMMEMFRTVITDCIPAADVVPGQDFRQCRNELCLRCGDYKRRHLGACDGCRWKDVG